MESTIPNMERFIFVHHDIINNVILEFEEENDLTMIAVRSSWKELMLTDRLKSLSLFRLIN